MAISFFTALLSFIRWQQYEYASLGIIANIRMIFPCRKGYLDSNCLSYACSGSFLLDDNTADKSVEAG